MRYYLVSILTALTILLASCAKGSEVDRLAYQDMSLQINAVFTLGDETVPATLMLEAPEYDENGRMLARDAVLTLGENSIISGVSFEFVGGEVYVSSGVLKIPIEDETLIEGISNIISLFCISKEHYYSSETVKLDGLECERVVYINGDNRVEVTLDLTCMLPTDIVAVIDGRTISADISMIRAE